MGCMFLYHMVSFKSYSCIVYMHCLYQVIGVVLANALMHSIVGSTAVQPEECDGLQPSCELNVRRTTSHADDVKPDLL